MLYAYQGVAISIRNFNSVFDAEEDTTGSGASGLLSAGSDFSITSEGASVVSKTYSFLELVVVVFVTELTLDMLLPPLPVP